MEVLFLLIPLSVALAAGFTIACLGSIRGGQFDDLESPRWRMLFDRRDVAPQDPPVVTLIPFIPSPPSHGDHPRSEAL